MPGLVERMMNAHPTRPGIPPDLMLAIIGEFAIGAITPAQASAAVAYISNGVPLNAGEQADAQALVDSVTAIPVTGTAVQIADGRARRALRVDEIERVLRLAGVAPYDHPDNVRARLGF